jgi:hypothetical protein
MSSPQIRQRVRRWFNVVIVFLINADEECVGVVVAQGSEFHEDLRSPVSTPSFVLHERPSVHHVLHDTTQLGKVESRDTVNILRLGSGFDDRLHDGLDDNADLSAVYGLGH